jgi:hypothetical protein
LPIALPRFGVLLSGPSALPTLAGFVVAGLLGDLRWVGVSRCALILLPRDPSCGGSGEPRQHGRERPDLIVRQDGDDGIVTERWTGAVDLHGPAGSRNDQAAQFVGGLG